MESSSERDYQDRRVGPTVSKDKWVNHAKNKLSRGYVLIVGKNRRSANFYMRSKGFEMCPFNIAKQMIKDGIIVEAGEHHLGTMYQLAQDVPPVETKKRPAEPIITAEEDESLLDDISDEGEEEDTDASDEEF